MGTIIYTMIADIIKNGMNYIIIQVPQEGIGTRYIDFEVLQNGIPMSLPTTDVTYTCKGTNGAGGGVMIDCTIENNRIRVPITENMASFAGIGKYRVEIYDSSAEFPVLSTFSFNISVERDPLSPTQVIASDDYQQLRDLISQAEGELNSWSLGHGLPSSSAGKNLDIYLNVDTGEVYQKNNGVWTYQGILGSQLYVAYATSDEGDNFSTTYSDEKTYLGIAKGQSKTQPTTPYSYTWIKISGGDNMRKSDYGGSDNETVKQADKIKGITTISNIQIPANTTSDTTTVTVNNSAITANCTVREIYTSVFGLNPISVSTMAGSMTLVFPALSTAAIAKIEIQ